MAEPIHPLLLQILDACKAQAPDPLYPKPFAIAESLDRTELDRGFDFLRLHGLIRLTDWVQDLGQGYVLTPEGERILANPMLLGRPLPKPQAPERGGHEHREGAWERGEAIRRSILDPCPPRISRVMLGLNLAVFALGLYLAQQRDITGVYLTGQASGHEAIALESLYVELGSLMPPLVGLGEWWRLFTYAFLHGGLLHIGLNMYFLFSIGPVVEGLWGSWRFLVLYVVSALGGGVGAYLANQGAIGASGALCGMLLSMGVWLYMSRKHLPGEFVARWQSNLITNVFLLVIISFLPGVSWSGHLGGALAGAAVSFALHVNRFGQGTIRWLGVAGMALLPVVLFGVIYLQPVVLYRVRLQAARNDVETRLIATYNTVAGPLFKSGPRAFGKNQDDVRAQVNELIADLQSLRTRFEAETGAADPRIQASATANVANLTAWVTFFEMIRDALANPDGWNNARFTALWEQRIRVQATQAMLADPHALIRTSLVEKHPE